MALCTPGGAEPRSPLPVILDPYGGPHFARVLNAYRATLEPQWLADQGFAVLVADGRGRRVVASPGSTPSTGTSPARCSRTRSTPSTPPPTASASSTSRRWGSGAGRSEGSSPRWRCSGAPTSSTPPSPARRSRTRPSTTPPTRSATWGCPQEEPEVYRRNSLIEDAPNLTRPLLLIHGLADDNVFVANTLRMSRALTEAGRLHSVVPLSGITHMTTEESVAENLLLLQVRFLREALGLEDERTHLRPPDRPPQIALLRSPACPSSCRNTAGPRSTASIGSASSPTGWCAPATPATT